ncbi:MAG: hypothetical protein IPO21_10465 [Bacteroidales bacterium]|nr:hypothetical protein [Bacteroidales bacterium]
MTKLIIVFFLILCSFSGISQAIYTGKIQNSNIELQIQANESMNIMAVYIISTYNNPILLSGSLKNDSLILFTRNTDFSIDDTIFIFSDYKNNYDNISGNYMNAATKEAFPVNFRKIGDIDSYPVKDKVFEILQATSSRDHYFKIRFSHNDSIIPAINIYDKKTNALIQTIEAEFLYREFYNVSVGDYNFDGIEDFSVFESFYAGANTSSIYYLRNKKKNQYSESGFTGTSLEFNAVSKTITEHNQCCAGRYVTITNYILENGKMVLINKSCMEFDEELNDFKEGPCND